VNQTIISLEAHRQSIIAHIATVEDFIRDETQSLEILIAFVDEELALAELAVAKAELALAELVVAELDEEEVENESI